ncbi:MAG: Rieske 2Fe-2S domain-containing protein [Bacteroidetes bacterium]|nr:Rieske 2Fe-2S domain-containing protein [Bacteroidota bacterium]
MDWIKIFDNRQEAIEKLRTPCLLVIRGRRICLAIFNKNIFAVQDKCTHNGESLCKGKINYLGEVVCPLHQYRFDLKTGREGEQRSADLECFPVQENEEGIFIGM